MAIPIIGETRTEDAAPTALPFPDVDLPLPNSAPEATPLQDGAALTAMLQHEHPYMRGYAVRRIGELDDKSVLDALIPLIEDTSVAVARAALDILHDEMHHAAADAVAALFEKADGQVAAQAAITLGSLAPTKLAESLKRRPRLDDQGYALAMMTLARTEDEAGRTLISKAMDRAAALQPMRRTALYTAALLSGEPKLVQRVVGLAISDSRIIEDDPKPSSSRTALAAAAGLPPSMAEIRAGSSLMAGLARESDTGYDEERSAKINEAVRSQAPLDAIDAVADLAGVEPWTHASESMKSAGRRCGVLLKMVVDRLDTLKDIPLDGTVLFAAVAIDSGSVVSASIKDATSSPGLAGLAKVLEVEANELAEADVKSLVERFEPMSPRMIRPVVAVLSTEPVNDPECLDRLCEGLLVSGHGGSLLEAAGDGKLDTVDNAVMRAMVKHKALAEPVVIEALEEHPLQPKVAALALRTSGQLGTERVGLAIGRRFLALREVARFPLAGAVLRIGDPRLAPLMKARAFRDEPEEIAWVVLSVLGGAAIEGELAEAADRLLNRDDRSEEVQGLRLPLMCTVCGEALTYTFPRVYVDPNAKDRHGDPAFVGDANCKACGAEDRFEPTDIAVQIMTEAMVAFLIEAEEGKPDKDLRVVPRRTRYLGEELSVAEALRRADADVDASPESIRARLRRARIRLILRRKSAFEDADAAVGIDGKSPEALFMRAGARAQAEDVNTAVQDLIEAHKLVIDDDQPRLYEETVTTVRSEIEASLLQLEALGASIPEDIDLSDARAAIARQMEAYEKAQAEREDADRRASESPEAPLPANATDGVGRNEPCPCGSGKKFKRCHGG